MLPPAHVRAALAYFTAVFAAGFVLGAIRVPFLVPRFGERLAELAEMPVMLVVIVLAARRIVRRHRAVLAPARFAAAGAIALALLLFAEFLLAVVIAGRGVGAYLASRDPVSGTVYLVMLGAFAAMPWLIARRGPGPPR
ncbi:MAG: hypothetical protein JNM90_16305 [Burkholderiales bacterium]|nr:hypothetical protein [Burkholderiales bacterium]